MKTDHPALPFGYHALAPGAIANLVTSLEMRERPDLSAAISAPSDLVLKDWRGCALEEYRALFRRVGEDYLWMSRLVMTDEALEANLRHPDVDVFALCRNAEPLGLLELDFRQKGECELAYFGVAAPLIGSGAAAWLMRKALERAWSKPIERFWVHTCSFDHPGAVRFYQKSGFKPYARQVEVIADPRLTGHIRADAAAHVPLLPVSVPEAAAQARQSITGEHGIHADLRAMANLSAAALYQLLKLRIDVFVVEQACAYGELDGYDAQALHLRILNGEELVAAARIFRPSPSALPRIGRVVVAPHQRGKKLGHQLMREAIAACRRLYPGEAIEISAQSHLQDFYVTYGFRVISDLYLEDGIWHVDMRLDSDAAGDGRGGRSGS